MNRVTIIFNECNPAPPKGYLVYWRAGNSGPLALLGTFFHSPISFLDDSPVGTQYNGIISSQYNTTACSNITWSTESGGPGSGSPGIMGDAMEVSLDITTVGICGGSMFVYVAPGTTTLSPGVILYQDAAMTMPVTGYLYVQQQPGVGDIYNLDVATGEVLTTTGTAC